MNNKYSNLSDYKYKLVTTLEELKKAIKEKDEQHMEVLFDRLEKRILGNSRI
jgi:hypothetical protein